METSRTIYSEVTHRYADAPLVSETLTTITLRFCRTQFPKETYNLTFDKQNGEPLDSKFKDVIYLADINIPTKTIRIKYKSKLGY